MKREELKPEWRALAIYLTIVFGLAWLPACALRSVHVDEQASVLKRLLLSSALYALTTGWQPLVAVLVVRRLVEAPRYLDAGLRAAAPRFISAAVGLPLLLSAAAMAIASQASSSGEQATSGVDFNTSLAPSAASALIALGFGGCAIVLLWLQAAGEEVGWRGYFLPRCMQLLGPWRGLVFHALAWGIWYAPLFLLTTDNLRSSLLRSACFLVTCVLLGTLLGWFRLISKSIVATAVANAVLTLAAGLPFVIQGANVGRRSAAYEPSGWVPMGIALILLALSRYRGAITLVESGGATSRTLPDLSSAHASRLH